MRNINKNYLRFKIIYLWILFLIISESYNTQSYATSLTEELRFYIISCDDCEGYKSRVEVLKKSFPNSNMVFYEIAETPNDKRFSRISEIVGETLYMPLVGVFKYEDLIAIASGGFSVEAWNSISKENLGGVPIYITDEKSQANVKKIVYDSSKIQVISKLFIEEEIDTVEFEKSFNQLILVIVAAAMVDAINPCCISVFIILLSYIFHEIGKKSVLTIGLAFISGIFISYLSLGLGLIRAFSNLPGVRYIISLFSIVLGLMRLFEVSGKKMKYLPEAFSTRISERINTVMNPKGGLVTGIITGLLLLPCSSAPYFIVIRMLSNNLTIKGLTLLVIYNLIIIAPFLIITMILHSQLYSTMEVKNWSIVNRRWLNTVVGVTLVVLGLINLVW